MQVDLLALLTLVGKVDLNEQDWDTAEERPIPPGPFLNDHNLESTSTVIQVEAHRDIGPRSQTRSDILVALGSGIQPV